MIKIVTVLGARPQFIKASVVSHAMVQNDQLQEVVIHTGQHFDVNMSDVFFSELGMSKPKYFLDIHGGGHGEMTGRMLSKIEQILLQENPHAVLVYGDTNSTLAGALAAAKLHIPVAHVEAGLRSFNMHMPEEINRVLTDRISRWLFTPTLAAERYLKNEGVQPNNIIPVGDVMYDAILHHGARVSHESGILKKLGLQPKNYVLATIHRAENTDNSERLTAIVNGLISVARVLPVVWPLHPRTSAILKQSGQLEELAKSVKLIDPLGYIDMVLLEKYASLIATDSGGVQKEAFFSQIPCITLRNETEWIELVEAGWNTLVIPESEEAVFSGIQSALGRCGHPIKPYGQGDASQKIITHLLQDLNA